MVVVGSVLFFVMVGGVSVATLPSVASADFLGLKQPTLIVCGGDLPGTDHECTFADVMTLARVLVNFVFFLSVPICIILFSYAGWLYITSGGDSGKVEEAHTIFKNVATGFAIILGAWLIVHTILVTLLNTNNYNIIQGNNSIQLGK